MSKKINFRIALAVFAALALSSTMAVAGGKSGEMIKIPGGEIESGIENAKVTVKPFQIDKYEVTFAQFKEQNKDYTFQEGMENHPASEISFFDAEEYCKAVGKRLPTGSEWERAAQGDDGRKWPWGNDFDAANANTMESDNGSPVPVGSFENGKSPYGVMDMCGNVGEWVNSWAGENKQYRLQMGGSYFDTSDRSTTTSSLKSIPDDTHPYTGFRCAK